MRSQCSWVTLAKQGSRQEGSPLVHLQVIYACLRLLLLPCCLSLKFSRILWQNVSSCPSDFPSATYGLLWHFPQSWQDCRKMEEIYTSTHVYSTTVHNNQNSQIAVWMGSTQMSINESMKCGLYIQWTIIQPLKGRKF